MPMPKTVPAPQVGASRRESARRHAMARGQMMRSPGTPWTLSGHGPTSARWSSMARVFGGASRAQS